VVEETYRGARKWSRNAQAVAAVVWISFLSASLATMLFFAFLDPVEVLGTVDPDIEIGHEAGYAIGFFFFWFVCAVCSAVTAWLVRTAPKRNQ
jgi:hypothetical protein